MEESVDGGLGMEEKWGRTRSVRENGINGRATAGVRDLDSCFAKAGDVWIFARAVAGAAGNFCRFPRFWPGIPFGQGSS